MHVVRTKVLLISALGTVIEDPVRVKDQRTFTRAHTHTHTHTNTHTQTRMQTHMHKHAHTDAHTHTNTRKHTCTNTHTHAQTHTHTHTNTHTSGGALKLRAEASAVVSQKQIAVLDLLPYISGSHVEFLVI